MILRTECHVSDHDIFRSKLSFGPTICRSTSILRSTMVRSDYGSVKLPWFEPLLSFGHGSYVLSINTISLISYCQQDQTSIITRFHSRTLIWLTSITLYPIRFRFQEQWTITIRSVYITTNPQALSLTLITTDPICIQIRWTSKSYQYAQPINIQP